MQIFRWKEKLNTAVLFGILVYEELVTKAMK